MKKIGLIGGMSWESSALYYQDVNRQIQQKLGALHSAEIILYSVNFNDIEQLQRHGEWDKAAQVLTDIAQKLESVGADCIVLCTNTMHRIADTIQAHVNIPFLHIADATIQAIKQHDLGENNIRKIGLLGTRFTMEQDFYSSRFFQQGLDVIIPNQQQRHIVHQVIYDELCQGVISERSRDQFKQIIEDLIASGAQGIVFGCTEIGMLMGSIDFDVAIFDTTQIHIAKIVEFILHQ